MVTATTVRPPLALSSMYSGAANRHLSLISLRACWDQRGQRGFGVWGFGGDEARRTGGKGQGAAHVGRQAGRPAAASLAARQEASLPARSTNARKHARARDCSPPTPNRVEDATGGGGGSQRPVQVTNPTHHQRVLVQPYLRERHANGEGTLVGAQPLGGTVQACLRRHRRRHRRLPRVLHLPGKGSGQRVAPAALHAGGAFAAAAAAAAAPAAAPPRSSTLPLLHAPRATPQRHGSLAPLLQPPLQVPCGHAAPHFHPSPLIPIPCAATAPPPRTTPHLPAELALAVGGAAAALRRLRAPPLILGDEGMRHLQGR